MEIVSSFGSFSPLPLAFGFGLIGCVFRFALLGKDVGLGSGLGTFSVVSMLEVSDTRVGSLELVLELFFAVLGPLVHALPIAGLSDEFELFGQVRAERTRVLWHRRSGADQ